MPRHSPLPFPLLCIFAFLLSLVACQQQVIVTGSGTFPSILVQNLLLSYYSVDDTTLVNYLQQPFHTSSSRFLSDQVDFVLGSETIPEENHTLSSCCNCDDIRALPVAVGGLALIHSIGGWETPSVSSVTLTRDQIAQIYNGGVTSWNQVNSSFPSVPIQVTYRNCSGSDTFTAGLAAMSSLWTQGVCPNAAFPIGHSVATDKAMLDYVMATPNAIGYVSYAFLSLSLTSTTFTNQLVGMVNKAGSTVLPGLNSFLSAANDFGNSMTNDGAGLWANIVDAPGTRSWPFAEFEYGTLRSKNDACDVLASLFSFFSWFLSGSREVRRAKLEPYGVGALPDPVLAAALVLLNSFSCCTRLSPTFLTVQGTAFGHSIFEDTAFTYFSGQQQINDTVTSSADAIAKVNKSTIDAALSIVAPTDSNLVSIKLFAVAVVCVANIQGFESGDGLVLNRSTLSAIFDGRITQWSDPAITSQNTNYQTNLANSGAIALQPFEDVDTRSVVSQALTKFDSSFTAGNLPGVSSSTGGPLAVLASVQATLGAAACVQFTSSLPLNPSASVIGLRNAAGTVINVPTGANVYSAVNDTIDSQSSVLIDNPGVDSWPICAYDYLVLNNDGRCAQLSALAKFVVWFYTSLDPQAYLIIDGASPPAPSITAIDQQKLYSITCNGAPITPDTKYVIGVGATFPLLVYQSWAVFFSSMVDPATNDPNVNVMVSYDTGGSAVGETFVRAGFLQFGTTDVPTGDDTNLVRLPMFAGALALVYNLGDNTPSKLVLTRDVIAKIYTGAITMWNDPQIQSLNTGISLPAENITLVYRSEACGSTYIMKQALQKFSTSWTYGVDMSTNWPVNSSLNVPESYDVANAVETHPYSLGYVEVSYANFTNLPVSTIINQAGNPTLPYPAGIESAMNDFNLTSDNLLRDITDGPGSASYPLASYTFALTPTNWPKESLANSSVCQTAVRTFTFLHWGMASATTRSRLVSLGFVPLHNDSLFDVEELLRSFTCGGKPVVPAIATGCDGVIGSGVELDACGECGGKNTTCCLGTPDQVKLNCFSCDYAPGFPPFLPNSYKCDGFLDCTGAEDDIHCSVSIVKTSTVLSAIAGICIVFCFLVGFDVFANRKERIFRESNVFFMMMILSGCIIGYAAVFVLSQLTKLNNFVCGTQYWFFGVAFVLTFGSMIAKTYQVYMLHRQHSGDLSAYTNQAIVRYVAAAMLVVFIILLVWTAFDRPRPVLRHNDPAENWKEHYICGNEHFTIFAILLALYFAIILVTGVVLSFLSRDIDFEGNESRLIRKTILSAALLAVVIFPILISLGSSFPFVRILLSNIALLLIASLIMFIYFGPKLYQFHLGESWSGGTPNYQSGKSGHHRLLGPIDI